MLPLLKEKNEFCISLTWRYKLTGIRFGLIPYNYNI